MKRLLPLIILSSCALSAEEQFLGSNKLDTCDGSVPVCSTTASCRLGEDENYVDLSVPGFRRFVVNTEGEADITLALYWKKQVSPGRDVEFTFWEPGCSEPHRVETTGEKMFNEVGQDKQWEVTQTVYEAGDHLVEMRMDAQGEFYLKVEITTPEERGQESNEEVAPEPELPGF
ncbi:MAG: hypothetical protein AB2A00_15210 [Myxococcota bacterium]